MSCETNSRELHIFVYNIFISRDLPYLFKIDLSEKTVIDKLEMTPASHGLYETAYSEVNKHAFVRSQVCCTCGFEGADLGDSCGRYSGSNVTVTTGTFA